ncbi:MAG: XdhC/CoxI family protein [Bacillota bacterium]
MNQQIYAQIIQALERKESAVLLKRFSGTQGVSAAMEKRLIVEKEPAFSDAEGLGAPVLKTEGGDLSVWEPFFPEERLIVLGCGHIALPLADFASKTGFSVTVVDDRPSFANAVRFPMAASVICEGFDTVFDRLDVTEGDYVVVITRGHRHDMECLRRLEKGPKPFYVGMIGSKRRVNTLKAALIEEGCDADWINRAHTPIGLPIGAVTPEEIAISILAEIILCKRLRYNGASRNISRSDMDLKVLKTLAAEKDVPKAIVTVVAAKGSVPRGPGAKMLVYPDGRILGSIGGGCGEAAVVGIARRTIGTRRYCLQTVDLTDDIAEEEGMVCGGVMQVLIEDYIA